MDNSSLYKTDYYNSHISKLRERDLFHRHRMKILLDLVSPRNGEMILDLGCGMGTLSVEFARLGARMVGIDSSEVGIEIAYRVFHKLGSGYAQFVVGDASRLPFADSTFDKVACADVVEHIHKPTYLEMLKESFRVLKPNGVLSIYTPCPTHIFEFLKKRNLILKADDSHIDLKDIDYLKRTLLDTSYEIQKQYFEVSFIPL